MQPLNTNEEMKMKIKCIDNKGNKLFTTGKDYRAWYDLDEDVWSDSDVGVHVCHGTLTLSAHGVFEIVEEPKPHPHADLMLKYAIIAQYDDKPWESFEFKNQYTDGWSRMADNPCFSTENEYRLKPQEPKIKVGQVWVDSKEVEVTIRNLSNGFVFINIEVGRLIIPWNFKKDKFLSDFKLK